MTYTYFTHNEILIRFLLAIIWGGIVGAEREYRSKAAGFRTMIMISVGSCFFTMMSMWIGVGNPDRIASNIVTGIGFLGAGVIFRGESKVIGITTAASIWAVAAVGMGIGGGFYFASAAASILIFIVLALLPMVEIRIDNFSQFRTYKIECTYSSGAIAHFDGLMSRSKLKFKLVSQVKEANKLTLIWQIQGHVKNHSQLADTLMSDPLVERLEC
jgi:putative Mg2+ transporter-C (MgtC) family protein